MTESADIRVSDTEREAAMTALGEHLADGRLDVDEYGERSAKVAAARTRGELVAVFVDLPDPRPVFGSPQPVRQAPQYGGPLPQQAPEPASGWGGDLTRSWDQRPVGQRLMAAAVPVAAIVAVVLFFTVLQVWWVFLLPAAVAMVGGAIWGEDWQHTRDQHHRQRRLAHDRRHEMRRAYRRDRRRGIDR